ncbi:phage portal protein [Schlesneria sp. DSM 10557]|uniref:phage portal protein n=1 Tax=Schlesneria sp. DSM 10557 TaxID=3044399 RepID=UPI0035A16E7F
MASPTIKSEDAELNQSKRDQLNAQANDALRNFAICRWAVGKHLDFVSRHSFICDTGDNRFDTDVQDLMDWYSNDPKNCDVMARHTLDRIVRMTEGRAVVEGDHLLLPLKSSHIQQVETDRLRSELGMALDGSEAHGVKLNKQGAATAYRIWKREVYGGYSNPQDYPANQVIYHGYWPTERSDQVRGIGLITAGLNDFCDAYEWVDLTKAAAKLRAAFGMIVTSKAVDGLGDHTEIEEATPILDQFGNPVACETTQKYEVEFGKGPFKLELDPGEDVKFLTDDSPSVQTFDFFKSTIGFALKSLDIPLCFYDEGLTNFFGQRAALILYLESCKTKRRNLVTNVLAPLTRWLIARWIAEGRLRLPAGANVSKIPFSWHPAGCPYWNPSQEINADIQAIGAGLGDWETIYLERTGRDWYRDMMRLKRQQQFLKENDISIDPKLIQMVQIMTDPAQMGGTNPLSQLPMGGLTV